MSEGYAPPGYSWFFLTWVSSDPITVNNESTFKLWTHGYEDCQWSFHFPSRYAPKIFRAFRSEIGITSAAGGAEWSARKENAELEVEDQAAT